MIAALAISLLAAIGARADSEFGGSSLNGTGPFIDSHRGLSTSNIVWIVSVCVSVVASCCVLAWVLYRRRQQRKLWADAERNGTVHRPAMMVQNPQWIPASTDPSYGFPAPPTQTPQPPQPQLEPVPPFVLPTHPSFSSSTVNHVDPSPFADSNGWRELQASGGAAASTDNLHEVADKPQRALSIGRKPGEMEREFQFPKRSMSDDSHPNSPTENLGHAPTFPEPEPSPSPASVPAITPAPEPASVPLPDDNDNERRSSELEVPMLQITSPDGVSGGFHFDDDEDSDDEEDRQRGSDNHRSPEPHHHYRRESSESEKEVYPPGLPIVTIHAPPTDAPDNRRV